MFFDEFSIVHVVCRCSSIFVDVHFLLWMFMYFPPIWEAGGISLASIWVAGAVPGAAWNWSGFRAETRIQRMCPGEGNGSVWAVQ